MAEMKTTKNKASVAQFLGGIEDDDKRKDAKAVNKLMREVTGKKPAMWGTSIVGFGSYDYKYASGREGTFFRVGFSPRKQNLTLYIMDGFSGYKSLLKKLGKHKTGKSCLYIKKLDDVDIDVLREMVKRSYESEAMGEKRS